MRTATRQAPPSPVGVVNGREIVDHRLRWRILLTCLLATAITHVHVLAARPRFPTTEMWRTAAVVATFPLTSLVVACVSPAASPDDISPVLERGMLYTSIVGGVACPISTWVKVAPQHPCHLVAMFPGALMCLVMGAVPLLGMRNAMNYWPAHRFALVASGVLQFARVAAQAYAPRLANAAAALGLSGLLPMPLAEQCQAHGIYLPGDVSLSGALVFGIMCCATGLALTPSMRTRLATLSGRFGLPAARVLRLSDGIVLEPDPIDPHELEHNGAEGVGLLASDSACSAHHDRRSQREAQQCRSSRDRAQLEVEPPPHPQKRAVRGNLLLDQPLVLGRPARRDQSCGGTNRRCGSEGTSATNSELGGAILHSATEAEGTLKEESRPGTNGSAYDWCGVQPHLPCVASSKGSNSSIGSSVDSIATEAHIYLRCMNDVRLRYDVPFDLGASTVYTPRPEFSASLADLPRRVSAVLSDADRANLLIEVDCDGCLVYASTGEPIVPSSPPYSSLCTRMFVALTSGAIYIPADDRVQFHTELAGNAPVIAAGEMVLSGGRLHSISNRSGHYRPAPESLRLVVSLLRSKGAKTTIPIKELHYDAAGNLEVQAMGATRRSPPAPIADLDAPPDLKSPPPGVDSPPMIVRVDVRGSGGREEISSVPYWSRPTRRPVRL